MPTTHSTGFVETLESLRTEYDVQEVRTFMDWIGKPDVTEPDTYQDIEAWYENVLSWIEELTVHVDYALRWGYTGTEKCVGGDGDGYAAIDKEMVTTVPWHGKEHVFAVPFSIADDPRVVAQLALTIDDRDDIVWGVGYTNSDIWIAPHKSVKFESPTIPE